MKEIDRWNVYWDEYTVETYLYGSEIYFHKKTDIEFRNELMPPGTVIKTWVSKTNYQANRYEPSLPMIDGEADYVIKTLIDCDRENGWLLKITYYDKFNNEAGVDIIRDPIAPFKCPLRTYHYKIQLMNAGAKVIHFHALQIAEVSYEDEEQDKKIKKNTRQSKKIKRRNSRTKR